ncbi:MAG: XdhC family protein [Candidatus Marinimicrobia bacterium]|nr:XdhC family protein [Candidatus Neomarinimicrobiota bacterium]
MDESIDYFILATHYRDDHEQTLSALKAGIPYVAVVASRKKAGLILDYLKENKIQDEALQRFHSPAGLDLKAKSPEEIALSILSEIVMLQNEGTGKMMNS